MQIVWLMNNAYNLAYLVEINILFVLNSKIYYILLPFRS